MAEVKSPCGLGPGRWWRRWGKASSSDWYWGSRVEWTWGGGGNGGEEERGGKDASEHLTGLTG